jgi:hypothetical protein
LEKERNFIGKRKTRLQTQIEKMKKLEVLSSVAVAVADDFTRCHL